MQSAPPDLVARVDALVAAVRARTSLAPTAGIILGSGLGSFADGLADAVAIPYAELPGFPTSSVVGHKGRLVIGRLDGSVIAAMQGRVHGYEGWPAWQVAIGARLLCRLGIRGLVVTNAAGGIRRGMQPGELMRITDHINLSGQNPLTGPNADAFGPRFPDMSTAYSPTLGALLEQVAASVGVPVTRGVYASLAGPSYETPAEIRMLATLGADAVGMSTVPEAIVASHMKVPVAGISCITNLAAGISEHPLSHEEVAETADRVRAQFGRMLAAFLPKIG